MEDLDRQLNILTRGMILKNPDVPETNLRPSSLERYFSDAPLNFISNDEVNNPIQEDQKDKLHNIYSG